jgi:hypothetical protein
MQFKNCLMDGNERCLEPAVVPDLRALSFGDALDHCNLISGAEVVYEHIVHEHEIQQLDAPGVCKQPCLGNLQSVQ